MRPIGLSRTLRRRAPGGASQPSLRSLSPVAWYRSFSNGANTDDGSSRLYTAADLSGNGRTAGPQAASNRLALGTSADFAKPCWTNGAAQYLQTPSWPSTSTPYSVAFALKASAKNAFYFLFDGDSAGNRTACFIAVLSPITLAMYNGGAQLNFAWDPTVASVYLLEYNGASSAAIVNGNVIATGTLPASTSTGETVTARYTLGSTGIPGDVLEYAFIPGAGGSVRSTILAYQRYWYPGIVV